MNKIDFVETCSGIYTHKKVWEGNPNPNPRE